MQGASHVWDPLEEQEKPKPKGKKAKEPKKQPSSDEPENPFPK
jgi:hypothetical protein